MCKKKIIILIVFIFLVLIRIDVKAENVTCTGYKWSSGSWGTMQSGTATSADAPTCSTTGTSYTQTETHSPGASECGDAYRASGCHRSRTWSKVTPNSCCCSGVTQSYYSCPNTCGGSACTSSALSFETTYEKVSHGNTLTYSVSLPDDASNTNWTLTSSDNTAAEVTNHSIKATNAGPGCIDVTLTASKDGDKKHSYTNATTTIKIYPAWVDEGIKKMPNTTNDCAGSYGITQTKADEEGLNVYRVECTGSNDTCKCHVYTRGCGSTPTPPPPACYIDNDGFMRFGVYTYSKKACKKGNNIVLCTGASDETALEQTECHNTPSCDTVSPKKDDQLTPCNGQGYNKGDFKFYCGLPNVFNSSGVPETKIFNEITCHEDIYLKFDGPVTDYSMEEQNNAYLYPATGFKYMLKGTSKLKCEGKFYNSFYEKFVDYLKKYSVEVANLNTTDSKLEAAMLESMLGDFSNLVAKSYLEWDPNYNFDATVLLTDEVAKVKNEVPYEVNLVKNKATEDIEENTWTCGKLLKDLDNPITIKSNHKLDLGSRANANFEYQQKQYFEKIVPKACLNASTGRVTYGEECDADRFLGSQFFISANRENVGKNDYNYTVSVTDMGFTGTAGKTYATNGTTGRLYILDNQIIYRHVDPSDAFLKKSFPDRVIGLNWSNSRYNFTRIIKPDTWTEDPLYNTIRLDKETNKEIKRLTKGNNATVYYVQKCSNNQSKICQLVNGAKRGTR